MDSNATNFQLDKDLESIPTIATSKMRLFELLEEEEADVREVERIISSDPAMAAKVIRLANSSFYRHSAGAMGIHEAIMTIGFDMVKCISLSIAVLETFGSNTLVAKDLWYHSYAVALTGCSLGRNRIEQEWLFTGGLLHDLGRMVLLYKCPEIYVPLCSATAWPSREREQEVFGTDHASLGRLVSSHWHFPDEVIEIIATHHEPAHRLSALVQIVDDHVHTLQGQTPSEETNQRARVLAGTSAEVLDDEIQASYNRSLSTLGSLL